MRLYRNINKMNETFLLLSYIGYSFLFFWKFNHRNFRDKWNFWLKTKRIQIEFNLLIQNKLAQQAVSNRQANLSAIFIAEPRIDHHEIAINLNKLYIFFFSLHLYFALSLFNSISVRFISHPVLVCWALFSILSYCEFHMKYSNRNERFEKNAFLSYHICVPIQIRLRKVKLQKKKEKNIYVQKRKKNS